jgi:hypothetical protein
MLRPDDTALRMLQRRQSLVDRQDWRQPRVLYLGFPGLGYLNVGDSVGEARPGVACDLGSNRRRRAYFFCLSPLFSLSVVNGPLRTDVRQDLLFVRFDSALFVAAHQIYIELRHP